MVLKVYGFPVSLATKRVTLILKELNVPYEFIFVDFPAGAHKSPAYMEYQPFGEVPYIDDDGFILYESRAIGRYIATKYASQGPKTPLLPQGTTDLVKYAKFEQAASMEMASFDPSATKVVSERVVKPMFGVKTDEEAVKAPLATLNAKLDVYEKILGKQKYLAGDDLTLADLYHLPNGHFLDVGGIDALTVRPNVARWWKDISSRPAWLAVLEEVSSY
ncbi:glutathione S-transferase-like protein [Stereum hirsutum FP-91666 SS1]|uniref:glutathione S-transferase-like protein n=1 Tax=Stereum hirsutum (strain FP-91666) TaxID=721885 RepID=UPI000444A79B|nr:glutathione S-transferase-like protein [Stereum hirsutum FP-91666 SS1]EIM86312.1 glutathione S-transferase-like protein [Stereum hirsutum FP-91666 SS1]